MLKNILAALLVSFTVNFSFANSGLQVVLDGSVARCQDLSDVSHRIYKMSVVRETVSEYVFKLETFQCVLNTAGTATILIPYALETPIIYKHKSDVLSYEMTGSYLSVTNDEQTAEFLQIPIDIKQQTQLLTLDRNKLSGTFVDLTVMALQLVRLNNHFFDQGLIFSGQYRIAR